MTATRAFGIIYISTLHRAFSPFEAPERALGGPNGRAPAMDALARNQGGLADGLEGMGDDPNALLGEAGEDALVGLPAREKVDFLGLDGVARVAKTSARVHSRCASSGSMTSIRKRAALQPPAAMSSRESSPSWALSKSTTAA